MVILNPLMPPRLEAGTIPNTQPFTMRENFSQMGLVEGMRHWIVDTLIPYINENFTELDDKWVEQANKLIADFETITIALVAEVNEAVSQMGDQVEQAEAAQAAAEAARDQAAIYASNVEAFQDTAITNIISDDQSSTFAKLSELFATASDLSTLTTTVTENASAITVIEDAIDGRLSDASLEGKFVRGIIMAGADIDPTGVADSTAGMQAVIDANPNGTIDVPEGVYKFGVLTLSQGQVLRGVGRSTYRDRYSVFGTPGWMNDANFGGTILRSTAASGVAVTIVDPDEVTEGGMENITLIGPGSGTATGVQLGGISPIKSLVNPQLTNVVIGNFARGFVMAYVNEGEFNSLIIRGCLVAGKFEVAVNHNIFNMLDVQWCGEGIEISSNSYSNTFLTPIFQSNTGWGVLLRGTKNLFLNPYFENNGGAIQVFAGANANKFETPFLNSLVDKILILAASFDNEVSNVSWSGAAATVEDNGSRTRVSGRIANLSGTATDRVVVDPGRAGTTFGPWDSFTPVITGLGWAFGNATVTGRMRRSGRTISGRIMIVWGDTSTFGGGAPKLSLPYVPVSRGMVQAHAVRNTVGSFDLFPRIDLSAATVNINARSAAGNGAAAAFTATYPATWQPGDTLEVFFDYEAIA